MLQATLNDDGTLTITGLTFDTNGTPSSSGKTKVHASTRGNTMVQVEGFDRPVAIGINVFSK